MKSLNILGIGRNTVTVMDLAEDCGFAIKSLLHYNDDRTGEYYFGHEIKGSFQYLNDRDSLEGNSSPSPWETWQSGSGYTR